MNLSLSCFDDCCRLGLASWEDVRVNVYVLVCREEKNMCVYKCPSMFMYFLV